MKYEGNFNYFLDGESKTREEIEKLINYNTTVSVKGFDVFYSSPKKENKVDRVLKQADEVQKQNGGRLDLDSLVYAFELQREPNDYWKQIADPKKRPFNLQKHIYGIMGESKDFDNSLSNALGIQMREGKIFTGKKETDGKLDYSEINFKLLDLMAKRFMDNKHKYPKGNTLKDINKDDILWAAFRHIRKMIQPIENDTETYEDHLAAVATNMSIILDQLYKNKLV